MVVEEVKPYNEEESKREQVEALFDNIASTYDKANHQMSLGIDVCWRKSAIKRLQKLSNMPYRILDVATGTGDLAIMTRKAFHHALHITGIDISEGMMKVGRQKVAAQGMSDSISFQYEDCSKLSFADNSFDAIISSFALRNFENIDICLKEMYRVMDKGGSIVVIDLCAPHKFPMKQVFGIYRNYIMPIYGRLVSKDEKAFRYLPETMDAIQQGEGMKERFERAGFENVEFKYLSFGMCVMYSGVKK